MIDLEQEVEIQWNRKNRPWYESKGYLYTGNHTSLIVRVKDLQRSSNVKIKYQCNNCGRTVEILFVKYNKSQNNICHLCSVRTVTAIKKTLPFEVVRKLFNDRGYELLSPPSDYKTNSSKLIYLCRIHGTQSIAYANLRNGSGCPKCCHEKRSREMTGLSKPSLSGENNPMHGRIRQLHPNWKGGVTSLTSCLRESIYEWKLNSMKQCDFKCVITGERFDIVHHLYGFNKLLYEVLEESNMDIRNDVSEYSSDEVELLKTKLLAKHYEYPLGVCLTKEIHALFHDHYGYGDNTPDQFSEFKHKYYKGEFKEIS